MGDLEALGTAVTGGMLARAVEPGAGEAAPMATPTSEIASTARRPLPAPIARNADKRLTSTGHCALSGATSWPEC